jgi:hypothetical protein
MSIRNTPCALLLALLLTGCASSSARVLQRASEISHFAAGYTPTPGDDMAGPLAELTTRLEAWGVRVEDLPETPGRPMVGLASLEYRVVQIQRGLSVNARFEVLAHEAGHLLQPPGLQDRAVAQLFAELVGVGIGKFYGAKHCEEIAAIYLASFKYVFGAEPHLRRDITYAIEAMTGQRALPRWNQGSH